MLNNKGKIGEIKAYNYLISQGYTVRDVTDNSDYWYQDIDFIAQKNEICKTLEVKWDYRISETHNMFIEQITNIDKGYESGKGWYRYCKSDEIWYGDAINNIFYVFRFDDLKHYIDTNNCFKRKSADYNNCGEVIKVSQGYIVPINDFKNKYQVQEIKL